MSAVAGYLLNGLSFGSLLFLVASGLTLTFGLMGTVNLAHGALYALGGYVALDLLDNGVPYWLALGGSVVVVGALGVALERGLLARIPGRELAQVVLTIGVAFVLADQVLARYGGRPRTPPRPPGLDEVLVIGGQPFPVFRLALIGVAVAVWLGLVALIARTRLGAMLRAAVDDEPIARATGIRVSLLFAAVFGLGSALAAFGGVWGGAFTGLAPGADFEILLLALVVVVGGGLGSVTGAFAMAMAVGLIDAVGTVLFPGFAIFAVYAPLAALLALRPRGLAGAVGRA